MSIWPVLDAVERIDMTLLSELSWAGGQFPFAGTEDVTINANTTWSDPAGFRKVRRLSIAAGVTLRIVRTPFYLFADEIEFGSATSSIDISGINGDQNPIQGNFARGGGDHTVARGGDGGGLLLAICNRLTGATGMIRANGGNAFGNSYSVTPQAGRGALVQDWGASCLHLLGHLMAAGGNGGPFSGSTGGYGGKGGGAGQATSTSGSGGGSGIGAGGGGSSNTFAGASGSAARNISPGDLLLLARLGCLGGGGGATGGNSGGYGGGGGGGVGVWYRAAENLPATQANGGVGSPGPLTGGSGGAGITLAVQV